ncbi:MAG: hypothetical protein GY785_06120, partial [Gammaproteobacteria bacterium]|nr:hypothetical protein [Gammaproteobacteria bacterium]
WENSSVGTPISASDITFQAQLLGNGTIIFSYVNVTDPNTANWQTKADQGIVVGITNGDGAWPTGSIDLSTTAPAAGGAEFGVGLIAYQIWCKNDTPNNPVSCMEAGLDRNNLFDLNDTSLVFNPDGATGFLVSDSIESGVGKGGTGICVTADGPGAPGAPALWEATYNDTELNGVAGGATGAMGPSEAIDGEESIALGFNFPFAGINYTHISVDDDGAIVLMNADAVTP